MRTPPDDLDAADLAAVLAVEWGLVRVGLTYAPAGFGGHHWIAGIGGAPSWFVTATRPREGAVAAFATAVALRDAGLDFVVAPVATELGEVVAAYLGYTVSVTPWLADAVEHAGGGPDVVELVAALHGATDAARGTARADDLAIEARAALDDGLESLGAAWSGGPYAAGVRELLTPAADALRARLAAYDAGAAAVDRAAFVVTHGEVKPGNLLATRGGVALVDWDTALLAPAERDLWRLDATDRAAYTARTGRAVDPAVCDLYRARWDLTDTALYVDELRRATVRTDDTETAWQQLRRLLG